LTFTMRMLFGSLFLKMALIRSLSSNTLILNNATKKIPAIYCKASNKAPTSPIHARNVY